MTDQTQIEAKAAADAPANVAKAVADTVETITKESAKVAKKTRAATARKTKRAAVAAKAATRRSAAKSTRKTKTAARKTATAAKQGTQTMNNANSFNGFTAVPGFAPFQNIFAQASEKSQEISKRGQKVAGELADLARANVEAVVEASRVAAEGARNVAQEAASSSRDGFEQAADAIRSFAEAKSPTEYLQLQGEFARASFDRAVAESSRLTESLVKLAGEAFQPLSNRASANAERFNTLVA